MPELDLFELTGLSFDPPEKNAKKVTAALDKAKRELEGQLGSVTQTVERNAINEKLAFISAMRDALFTPDGKITAKMTELADERKNKAKASLESLIALTELGGGEKVITNGFIKAQRRTTKLSDASIEEVYKAHGFQIVKIDPLAAFPKFPVNADKIYQDLAQLRASHDPAPNSPDPSKVDDLYAFAAYISGEPENAPAYRELPSQKLCQLFDGYAKQNAMRHDDLGKLCVSLATAAKTYVFDSDEHRKAYADHLLYRGPEMTRLAKAIENAPREQRELSSFYEQCLDIIAGIFGDQDVALSIYNKIAGVMVIPVAPKYRVKCASCHALSSYKTLEEAQRVNKCASCGEALFRKCPKCSAMVLRLDDRCPKCFYVFASAGLFNKYYTAAEAAFRRGDLDGAREQLAMAESADPGEKTRSGALRQKIEAEEQRYREPLQQLGQLMRQNRYQAAAQYIANTIARSYPNLNVSTQDAQIRAVLAGCQQRIASAGSSKTARVNACLDALDSCADYGPALDFLRSAAAAPAPCAAIDFSTDDEKGSITLSWQGSAERGVRYLLLRKEGGQLPKDRSDGRVLLRDSGELLYTDSSVEPGSSYGYAVFAERMGVYSPPCACRAAVYSRVSALRCEQKGKSVFLSWAAPAQSSGVEAIRTMNGSSQRLSPRSRGSLEDRDLPFNTPLSYSVCALYPDGGRSARRQVSITLTPEVRSFRISATRLLDGSYEVKWTIPEPGIDLQMLCNGRLAATARSESGGARLQLSPNGFYSISVQALSSGTWTPSDNTVSINTFTACELDPLGCSLTPETGRSGGRGMEQTVFELKIKGSLPAEAKGFLCFLRTKAPGVTGAPWVLPEEAATARDGMRIDADAYRRSGAIRFAVPAGDEDSYYITLYTIYQASGRDIISAPARRRLSRPIHADLFWKVNRPLWGDMTLQLDLVPDRPIVRRPALVLCASQTGRTLLSLADPNAIPLAEFSERQLDMPQARLHEELPLARLGRNTKLFLFEQDPVQGEQFTLRWASGFDGKA